MVGSFDVEGVKVDNSWAVYNPTFSDLLTVFCVTYLELC